MPASLAKLRNALLRATKASDALRRRLRNAERRRQRLAAQVAQREAREAAAPPRRTPGHPGKGKFWTCDAIAAAEAAWITAHGGRRPRRFDFDNDPTLPHSTTVWRARRTAKVSG